MKTKITYWCLCVCLCVSFLSKASSGIEQADSLFAAKQYQDASLEYEKAIFACGNDSIKNFYLFKKSLCQKFSGNFNAEVKTLTRINFSTCADSFACAVYYEHALADYVITDFKRSNDLLERAHALPISTSEYNSCLLLHGFVLNELNDYTQAKNKFSEYYKVTGDSKSLKGQSLIDSLYSAKFIPKLKSLKKAKRMSLIVPGLGLFYARKPGKAITNITLLLSAAAYTTYNIVITNYYTAATSGLYFMRYFYTGGVNQLNDEIPKYNYKKTRKFNDAVKNKLISTLSL